MNQFQILVEIFHNKEIIVRYKHDKYSTWKKTTYIYYRKPNSKFPIQLEFDERVFELLKKYELLDQTGGNWEEHSSTYILDIAKLKKYFISYRDKEKNISYDISCRLLDDYQINQSKFDYLKRKFRLDKLIEET